MPEQFLVVPEAEHEALVAAAYKKRGFTDDEANDAARFCSFASAHAVRTHNAIKALHLDDLFGSGAGGCVPGANIEVIENRFAASEVWNCNRKLGQSVAYAAIERCIELADQYGVGQVHCLHQLHGRPGRGGAFHGQASHPGHQPAQLGIPHR